MKKRLQFITTKCFSVLMSVVLAVIFMAVLAEGTALAEKPPRAGNGRDAKQRTQQEINQRHEVNQRHEEKRRPYFSEQHRAYIHDYYAQQYRRGHCPPGLAKKHNGCMPPGQAKKWVIGRPLPRGVIFYDLPPSILVQLGQPPSHHRFVRVAQDILLIATGTGMVVDAIDNLNWEFSH